MGIDGPLRDPQQEASERALREYWRNVNTFYHKLSVENQTLLGDVRRVLLRLDFQELALFGEEAPQVPVEETETACKKYFLEQVAEPAREAIGKRDLMGLRKLLGPELYALDQTYTKQTRDNYWGWLQIKCELEVKRLQLKICIKFAQKNHFPSHLDEKQKKLLKAEVGKELADTIQDLECLQQLIARWAPLDEALKVTATRHLQLLLQKKQDNSDDFFSSGRSSYDEL